MTFIILMATFAGHLVHAQPPVRRLISMIPSDGCTISLTRPSFEREFLSFFDLSHPLVRRYLATRTQADDDTDRIKRADARLLVLIYGDQPMFDLRSRARQRELRNLKLGPAVLAATDGQNLDSFATQMRWWSFRTDSARLKIVEDVIDVYLAAKWRPYFPTATQMFFLEDYQVTRAFWHPRHFMFSSPLAHNNWDFDDPEHVSRRLHARIAELRQTLRENATVRNALVRALAARVGPTSLPVVTRAARTFTRGFAERIANEPDPMRTLSKKIERTQSWRRRAGPRFLKY